MTRHTLAKPSRTIARALVLGALSLGLAAPANAYPASVEGACKNDYVKFCAIYPLQSASLRQCMESKASELSNGCKRALIDAGYVDRRRLKR